MGDRDHQNIAQLYQQYIKAQPKGTYIDKAKQKYHDARLKSLFGEPED